MPLSVQWEGQEWRSADLGAVCHELSQEVNGAMEEQDAPQLSRPLSAPRRADGVESRSRGVNGQVDYVTRNLHTLQLSCFSSSS